MFSSRLPSELAPNRLAAAVAARRAAGQPLVDLTESNPTRAGFDYPLDLLAPLSAPDSLRYRPSPTGSPEARAAVARDFARQGLDVRPDRLVLTASTSDAYSMLFKLLADAGDDVLLPRPSYPLFDHLTRLDLVTPRAYDLEYHGRWSIDFASLERSLTDRTRAVLVVSPNNPTGSLVTRDELARLEEVCAPRGIAIVADEVFADYAWRPDAQRTSGRAAACRRALAFALGGLSKSVGLPQVKLGWMAVAGPDALVDAAMTRLEIIADAYLQVSTPVQVAAGALLERGAVVRDQIVSRVRGNLARLRGVMAGAPSCRVLDGDGGWYAVVQVPTFEPEEALVLGLLERDGVLVHPGYFFDFPRESFLVVSLLPPADAFEHGVGAIAARFASEAARG